MKNEVMEKEIIFDDRLLLPMAIPGILLGALVAFFDKTGQIAWWLWPFFILFSGGTGVVLISGILTLSIKFKMLRATGLSAVEAVWVFVAATLPFFGYALLWLLLRDWMQAIFITAAIAAIIGWPLHSLYRARKERNKLNVISEK